MATDYLERAGCSMADDGRPLRLPDAATVDAVAGQSSLRAPAAALMGAFAAVEHIRATLDASEPRPFPSNLRLSPAD